MSEAKFTKGPWIGKSGSGKWPSMGAWSVDNDTAGSHSAVAISSKKGVVCLVVQKGLGDSPMDENASLIAAAPEMYEMLEEILRVYEMDYDDTNKAMKLLAKARGEKQ